MTPVTSQCITVQCAHTDLEDWSPSRHANFDFRLELDREISPRSFSRRFRDVVSVSCDVIGVKTQTNITSKALY